MSEIIDNRAHRISTMKSIITRLHEGADPEEVRGKLTELVKETDASEIAAMEQELINHGMPAEKIQSMCDLHAQVLRDITKNPEEQEVPPGHPVDTFRMENFAIQNTIKRIRDRKDHLANAEEDINLPEFITDQQLLVNKLMDIEKHYVRKENLLFPYLEKRDITGPSQVMWGKDDEVRKLLADLRESLNTVAANRSDLLILLDKSAEEAFHAIEEMIYKEENILIPMAMQTLTEEEWGEIFNQSPETGWCMVEPRSGYRPPQTVLPREIAEISQEAAIRFPGGSLKPDQLAAIFKTVPFDLTFVDADDRVAFFTHGPDSIFPRNTTIIGRKVQHCHPPKSVNIVEQILSDFKSGRQSSAEFWITFQDNFVHIRYFAVREENNDYLGTLEITQDITKIRKLEGERRLPNYGQ